MRELVIYWDNNDIRQEAHIAWVKTIKEGRALVRKFKKQGVWAMLVVERT